MKKKFVPDIETFRVASGERVNVGHDNEKLIVTVNLITGLENCSMDHSSVAQCSTLSLSITPPPLRWDSRHIVNGINAMNT